MRRHRSLNPFRSLTGALALGAALSGCDLMKQDPGEGPIVLSLSLHDSLSRYERVRVKVTSTTDTNRVLHTLHDSVLLSPSNGIRTQTLTRVKDPFLVQVRGFRELAGVAGTEQLGLSTNIYYEGGRKRVVHQPVPPMSPFNWLGRLLPSSGNLEPPFNADVLGYRLAMGPGVNSVSLEPLAAYSKAVVMVAGEVVRAGTQKAVTFGLEDTTIAVTVSDLGVVRTYQVLIVPAKPELDSLWVSRGALVPGFTRGHTDYNLTLPASAASVDLRFWSSDPANTVLHFRGNQITSGSLQTVAVAPGGVALTTVVVQKGAYRKEYTLRIERLR